MRLMKALWPSIRASLRRRGVPLSAIGEIERETLKAQLLAAPEAERLASGRQFLSSENQALLREQATKSHREEFPEDFVYDFVAPGPGDNFEFGINYAACGFCKLRTARHGDKEILPNICGLDFRRLCNAEASAWKETKPLAGWREPLRFPILAASVGLGRHTQYVYFASFASPSRVLSRFEFPDYFHFALRRFHSKKSPGRLTGQAVPAATAA